MHFGSSVVGVISQMALDDACAHVTISAGCTLAFRIGTSSPHWVLAHAKSTLEVASSRATSLSPAFDLCLPAMKVQPVSIPLALGPK